MHTKQTEPYLSTYLHAKGNQLGLPIAGNFELTARCNFRCPMCYVHLSQTEELLTKELTASQWLDLARQARDAGMVFALLTGGEPFLRKDFFEIYSGMKAMGLLVSINTNGSMLQGEIRRKLLENPPHRVNLSLYGGNPQTYRDMCGQDAFSQVVENIRALKSAGVDVRLNLSITPWNKQDIAKIYEIAQQLEVQVKASAYMYPPIRLEGQPGTTKNRLTPEEAAQCMVQWDLLRFTPEEFSQRAEAMARMCAMEHDGCSVDDEAGVGCRAGSTSFWVTWDGRMLPCGMMPGPEVLPLEIGFPQAWQQMRQGTREIPPSPQCASCPSREICAACAAVRVTECGSFDGTPEYMCRMTEHIRLKTQQAYQQRSEDTHGN